MAEETMSTNFIHSIIEEELKPGGRCVLPWHGFLQIFYSD